MITVYILRSEAFDRFYVGQTGDLKNRLRLHNAGLVRSTKRYLPWKVVYNEEQASRLAAVSREKYLKSHAGRAWLKNNVK